MEVEDQIILSGPHNYLLMVCNNFKEHIKIVFTQLHKNEDN
jgi:hypothetical protein